VSALSSLFTGHSSSDRAAAADIGGRLKGEGYQDLYLDFDPEHGIPAGRNWEREFCTQLRKADGIVFLAGAASVASRCCCALPTFAGVRTRRSCSFHWESHYRNEFRLRGVGRWHISRSSTESVTNRNPRLS